ncbi:MAG: hypothetical protein HXS54_01360 [Theionarchaea archaeon]|nr:hypothetical protein [Theionarchaea archaeon]
MKFHVLTILNDSNNKWWWWRDIYDELPLLDKPKPQSFQDYMNKLAKKGKYTSKVIKRNGKYVRIKTWRKRTYVQKKKVNKKVYYRISTSGRRILKKMHSGNNLKHLRQKTY